MRGLAKINLTRKPNGQLSSETAYLLMQRRAGLARARSRTDGFKCLIDAGRKAARKRQLLGLLSKLANLGIECEHTKALLASLNAKQTQG